MQTGAVKKRRSKGINTPSWIVMGIILSGGLFLFAWLALLGRRILAPNSVSLLWLPATGAVVWIAAGSAMVRGALAPTIPGETGNPLFLVGFLLAVVCIALMLVFNKSFTRRLVKEGSAKAIHGRAIGFTLAAVGFLLGQLIHEMTPVAPQNRDILALFQLICIMVASVVGIQWVERVHATYTATLSESSSPTASAATMAEHSA